MIEGANRREQWRKYISKRISEQGLQVSSFEEAVRVICLYMECAKNAMMNDALSIMLSISRRSKTKGSLEEGLKIQVETIVKLKILVISVLPKGFLANILGTTAAGEVARERKLQRIGKESHVDPVWGDSLSYDKIKIYMSIEMQAFQKNCLQTE